MDIQALKDTFEFFDDWEDKYRFVIDLGKDLPTLKHPSGLTKILSAAVRVRSGWFTSCVTIPSHFAMDSDAHIVRGLISIVLIALNDRSPAEILATDIEALFDELQLLSHLSATRGNGLRAMIQRIRQVAGAAN